MRAVLLPSLLALLAFPLAALAIPPDACSMLSAQDINSIAERQVDKVQLQRAGNPSECGFLDSRRSAVLVLSIREVQYAVKDEFGHERENLEKIYKGRVKWLTGTLGDDAFWMPVNKQLMFRKGKKLVSLTFSREKNRNEVDTAQLARIVESRL